MGWIGYRQDVTRRGDGKLSGAGIGCYIGGKKTYDERTLRSYDWEHRGDVLDKGIVAPENAPSWAKSMEAEPNLHRFGQLLENEEDRYLERYHRAKGDGHVMLLKEKAVTDFRAIVDLPIELDQQQAKALAREFLLEAYGKHGIMVGYALHWEEGNPHLHVFGSTRKLTEQGLGARLKGFSRYGQRRDELVRIRETFARVGNRHLVEAGFAPRLDHRSYEDQGLDLVPTVHEGAAARGRSERGEESDVVAQNQERREENIRRLSEDPDAVIRSVAAHSAAFTEGQLKGELFRLVGGDEAAFEAISPRLMSHPSLVKVGRDARGNDYFSTAGNQEAERVFRGLVDGLKDGVRPESIDASRAIQVLDSRFGYMRAPKSDQQREALSEVLLNQRLTVVEGRAGVGKTTLFKAAHAIYQQQGFTVRGFAMAGAAADNLQDETGILSQTLDSFTVRVNRLAELEEQAALLRDSLKPSLSVKASVDWKPALYLRSPIRFSFLHGVRLVKPLGLKIRPKLFLKPRLVREGEKELRALERQIETLRAETRFDSRSVLVVDEAGMAGTVQLTPLLKAAMEGGAKVVLVGDSHQFKAIAQGDAFRYASTKARSKVVISTVRRQEVDWQREATVALSDKRVKDAITAYVNEGRLFASDTDAGAVTELVDNYMARRASGVAGADNQLILAFTHKDVDRLNDEVRSRLKAQGVIRDVVTVGGREFGIGDRVVFTVNRAPSEDLRDLSGHGVRVRNGTFGVITGIEGSGETLRFRMRLGNRADEVTVRAGAYAPELVHGFATTFHKAQGQTVNYSYLLASDMPRDDAAYVALSRHRLDTEIHWSRERFESVDDLVRRWERPAYKALLEDFDRLKQDPAVLSLVTNYVTARVEAGKLAARIREEIAVTGGDFFSHPLAGALVAYSRQRRAEAGAILADWDRHALAVLQVGLTKARVQEDARRKQAPEVAVRGDVEELLVRYADLNARARAGHAELRADLAPAAMKLDPRYAAFAALREERGALAAQILKGGAAFRRAAPAHGLSWQAIKSQAAEWRTRQAQAGAMERLKAADAESHQLLNRYRNGRVIAAGLKQRGEGNTPDYYRLLADNEKRAARILHRWERFEIDAGGLGLDDKLLLHHAARGELRLAVEHLAATSGEQRALAGASLQAKLDRLPKIHERFAAAVAKEHGIDWRAFRRALPAGAAVDEKPDFGALFRGMNRQERRQVIQEYRRQVGGLDELERDRSLERIRDGLEKVRKERKAAPRQATLLGLDLGALHRRLDRLEAQTGARPAGEKSSAPTPQAASPRVGLRQDTGVPETGGAAEKAVGVATHLPKTRQLLEKLRQAQAGEAQEKTAGEVAGDALKTTVRQIVRAVIRV